MGKREFLWSQIWLLDNVNCHSKSTFKETWNFNNADSIISIILLLYYFSILLSYCITILLYYYFIVLLFYCIVLYYYSYILIYRYYFLLYYNNYFSILLFYCIIILLYYLFTTNSYNLIIQRCKNTWMNDFWTWECMYFVMNLINLFLWSTMHDYLFCKALVP
jgi:hypothetical protein